VGGCDGSEGEGVEAEGGGGWGVGFYAFGGGLWGRMGG